MRRSAIFLFVILVCISKNGWGHHHQRFFPSCPFMWCQCPFCIFVNINPGINLTSTTPTTTTELDRLEDTTTTTLDYETIETTTELVTETTTEIPETTEPETTTTEVTETTTVETTVPETEPPTTTTRRRTTTTTRSTFAPIRETTPKPSSWCEGSIYNWNYRFGWWSNYFQPINTCSMCGTSWLNFVFERRRPRPEKQQFRPPRFSDRFIKYPGIRNQPNYLYGQRRRSNHYRQTPWRNRSFLFNRNLL